MEWQTGPDVGNNQSTTSKNESNNKPVAGHYQESLQYNPIISGKLVSWYIIL